MKKRISKLLMLVILAMGVTLTAFGCDKPDPIIVPPIEVPVSVAEAAGEALGALQKDIKEVQTEYTISFKMEIGIDEDSTLVTGIVSVDTTTPLNTKVYATAEKGDVFQQVYYTNGILYIDSIEVEGREPEKGYLHGINMTTIANTFLADLNSQAFNDRFLNSIKELVSYENNEIVFDVDIKQIIDKIYVLLIDQLGGNDLIADMFSLGGLSKQDIAGSTNQKLSFKKTATGSIDSINFSSKAGARNISLNIYDMVVANTVSPIVEIPSESELEEYAEFSLGTFSSSGKITFDYVGKTLEDLTGNLGSIDMQLTPFSVDIPYTLKFVADLEEIKLEKLYLKLLVPSSMMSGTGYDRDEYPIEIIYDTEDNSLYIDMSSVSVGCICLNLSSPMFGDMFEINGEKGTMQDIINAVMATFTGDINFESGITVELPLEVNTIDEIFNILGVKKFIDITKINAKFTIENNGISDLSAEIIMESGNKLTLTSESSVVGINTANIDIDKAKFKNYQDVDATTIVTNGSIALPDGVDGNEVIGNFLRKITNDKDLKFTTYNEQLKYTLFIDFNLENINDIDILVDIIGDDENNEGLLLGYNRIDRLITIMSSKNGVYKLAYEIDERNLGDESSFSAFISKIDDMFGTETPSILEFFFSNNGIETSAQIIVNFLAGLFNDTGYLRGVSINAKTGFEATVTLRNSGQFVVVPNRLNVHYSHLELKTNANISDDFNVFGHNTSLNNIVFNFSTESDTNNSFSSLTRRVEPVLVGYQLDDVVAGAGPGYLNMKVAGYSARVRASSIKSTEVEGIQLQYNSLYYDKDTDDGITIDVGNYSSYNANELINSIKAIANAKFTMGNGNTVEGIVKITSDVESLLSTHSFNGVSQLDFEYSDNLGNSYESSINITIKNYTVDMNANIDTLPINMNAYGGLDPRKVESYQQFYNVQERKLTNTFEAATCLVLTWDISNIIDQYRKTEWSPYMGDTQIEISAEAVSVTGYTKNIKAICTIFGDIITYDEVDFNIAGVTFGDGITYNNHQLYIDPFICSEIKGELVMNAGFANVSLGYNIGVDTPEERKFSIEWKENNTIVPIYREVNNGNEVVEEEVTIDNNGMTDCYIKFLVGDNNGGYQTVRMPITVYKRVIATHTVQGTKYLKWSFENILQDTAPMQSMSDIDPMAFTKQIQERMRRGIAYVELQTDNFTSILVADTSVRATFSVGNDSYTVALNLNTKEWQIYVGNSESIALEGGDYLKPGNLVTNNNVDISEFFNELVFNITSWEENYRYIKFNFNEEDLDGLLSTTSDNIFEAKQLTATARIGSQELKLIVEFSSLTMNLDNALPSFDEELISRGDIEVLPGSISDNKAIHINFDPYGRFDFTNINNYPTTIRINDKFYDVEWDISELLETINGKTVYQGISNYNIIAKIVRGNNVNNGIATDYIYEIVMTSSIKSGVIAENFINSSSDRYKTGHYMNENDTVSDYDDTMYDDQGKVIIRPIVISGQSFKLNDPRLVENYAGYIGVSFDMQSIYSRWLMVREGSWNIDSIINLYDNKYINEVNIPEGSEFLISCEVGNEFAGYQRVYFSATIEDSTVKKLQINTLENIPQYVNQNGVETNASDKIDYSGENPKIEFNPYVINVNDTQQYPLAVTLNKGESDSNFEKVTYKITNWDLQGASSITKGQEYLGGSFTALVTVMDTLRYPVDVVLQSRIITAVAENAGYRIVFDPTATDKSVLGGNFDSVEWTLVGNEIIYQDTAVAKKFMFRTYSDDEKMTLNVKFDKKYVPASNDSVLTINDMLVGNDVGGYQPMPSSITTEFISIAPIFSKIEYRNSSGIAVIICEMIDNIIDFKTIPNERIEELVGIFGKTEKKFKRLGINDDLSNGLYFEWANRENERLDSLPYYINLYNYIEIFDIKYSISERDIVVRKNIVDWFDAELIKDFKFEWNEAFSEANTIANTVLSELRENGIDIDRYLVENFGDIASINNGVANIASQIQYVEGNAGFDPTMDTINSMKKVNRIEKPGVYTAYYNLETGIDPKYYGVASFTFNVEKKDLFDAGALYVTLNNIEIGNDNESLASSYIKDQAVNMIVSIASEVQEYYQSYGITLKLMYSATSSFGIPASNAVWTEDAPKELGNYYVKIDVLNVGEPHALYTSSALFKLVIKPYEISIPSAEAYSNFMQIGYANASHSFNSSANFLSIVSTTGNHMPNGQNIIFTYGDSVQGYKLYKLTASGYTEIDIAEEYANATNEQELTYYIKLEGNYTLKIGTNAVGVYSEYLAVSVKVVKD